MATINYPLFHDTDFSWFISSGPKGDIPKGIFVSPADVPAASNPYNLGLADYINGKWTDENRTNNGDLEKVMGTLAAFVIDHPDQFPDRGIFVRGNTEPKRRLYQRFVSNSLEEINKNYNIFGKEYQSDGFELFVKGKIYEALLVERK
jgi:hypothetical protein